VAKISPRGGGRDRAGDLFLFPFFNRKLQIFLNPDF
jgi:hypothetical protein